MLLSIILIHLPVTYRTIDPFHWSTNSSVVEIEDDRKNTNSNFFFSFFYSPEISGRAFLHTPQTNQPQKELAPRHPHQSKYSDHFKMEASKRVHIEKAQNFFRQYRDPQGELRKLSANQFMEVWGHYDKDANGYIEGTELDGFLREFVSSANSSEVSPEVRADRCHGELGPARFLYRMCPFLHTHRRVITLGASGSNTLSFPSRRPLPDTHRCDAGGVKGLLHGGVRRQPRWQN